jgi:hypothetical protein
MANVKFSDFAVRTTIPTVDYIVGYQGADNIQIEPTDFLGDYLPLTGGVMIGTINFSDNVKAIWGNGSDLQIYHDTLNSYISDQGTGRLILKTNYLEVQNAAGTEAIIEGIEDDAVKLYYDGVKKFETEASGVLITSGSYCSWGTSGVTSIEGSTVSNKIAFRTLSTERMRIDSTGYVGIGTATPGYNLEVDGTATVATDPSYIVATAGSFVMAMGAENAPGVRQEAFVGSLGATDFKLKANNTDIGRFTQTKRFVIGRDANPSSTIEAFTGGNSVDAAMLLQHDSFGADRVVGVAFELGSLQPKGAVAFRSDDDTTGQNWGIGNLIFCVDSVDDNNPVTKSDEKMRITHAGNVGIAVDNPEARLQVNEIPQAGGSTTTAASLAHFVGSTAPSTVNGFATLKLEYPAGNVSGDPGAQIMFTQGYHSGDPDNTQPVGSLRGYRTGADTQYGGGLQLTYQPNGSPLGLLPGITLDGDGNTQFHENIYIGDNKKANFGNSNDLQIYHDGVNSYIEDLGSGNLYIQFYERMRFQDNTGAAGTIAAFNVDSGGCQFYYIGALKLQTTNTGTVVTGQMDIAALNTAPANAGDTGTLGEIRYTADYIYVCVATDTWKRSAISTW